MWTRKELGTMVESDLRTKILIPLFKAMGYLDVFEYHGGSQEQGKDILMWKRDPLRGRVNFAVVAKAQRISGAAEGTNSAGGVIVQIQQCFGRPYQDPRSSQELRVHNVIVVSSKEIKKEALVSISSGLLPTGLDRHVTFADGDQLWDWIIEHMPRSALTDLEHASKVLGDIDENVRLTAILRDGKVSIGIEAKDGKEPFTFRLTGKFPTTTEGKKAFAAFDKHLRTGAPVELDGRFVSIEGLPEPLRNMFSSQLERIALGPAKSAKLVRLRMEVQQSNGSVVLLPGLEFKIVQQGIDEATLSNEHQRLPWVFRLVLVRIDHRFDATMTSNWTEMPASRALQAAQIRNAMARGGEICFIDEDTGLRFVSGTLAVGIGEPVPDGFIKFLEALMFIQGATRKVVTLPYRDFEDPEFTEVERVRTAIASGRLTGTCASVNVTLTREGAVLLRDTGESKPSSIALVREEVAQILGTPVSLGPVLTSIRGLGLDSKEVVALGERLKQDSDSIEVILRPVTSVADAEQFFLNWLPEEEIADLRNRFPEVKFPANDR